MEITQRLLDKYDVRGPRYTSYPTALQFNSQFGVDDYYRHLEVSNEAPASKPLSLYLHIPFCQSLCFYCGCHKIVTQNKSKAQGYLETLKQEIKLQGKLFAKNREVKQLHLGGGTPTYFNPGEINQLLKTVEQYFTLAPVSQRESGIEIDPRTTSVEDIKELVNIGFNRMSFGIQDFDHEVQIAINRIQDQEQTLQLLETARSAGVDSISIDLIYGLPKQTPKSFVKTLRTILSARPDRISLYNYAHMPHLIQAQKLIQESDIPTPATKLALLKINVQTLTEAGYQYIGMDHFALPGDPLSQSLKQGTLHRNFQGYSTHGNCDTVGLGVSAISQVGNSFSQNYKKINDYTRCIQGQRLAIEKGYTLSVDDNIRSAIIQSIMCCQHIDINRFNQSYDILFESYFQNELEKLKPMITDGLLNLTQDALTITKKGRFVIRNIAMVFDAYLSPQKQHGTEPIKFSKVL